VAKPTNDSLMNVVTMAATAAPQQLVAAAARQCYASEPHLPCFITKQNGGSEAVAEHSNGSWVIEALLKGNKGHWSPLEHIYITLAATYVPHDCMVQMRTHRHLSFSEQSLRYTSSQFESLDVDLQHELLLNESPTPDLDKLVYFRLPGTYADRKGSYKRGVEQDLADRHQALALVEFYQKAILAGAAPEAARGLLPYNVRKHAYISGNLRAWLHVADLRNKADAQPEIQQLSSLTNRELVNWCPELVDWYNQNLSLIHI
jgi:thymidylate synthase (FAD)